MRRGLCGRKIELTGSMVIPCPLGHHPIMLFGRPIDLGMSSSLGIGNSDMLEVNVGNDTFHPRAFAAPLNITLQEINDLPMDKLCLRVKGFDRLLLPLQVLIALKVIEK
jgi:hypothetical protein